MQKSRKLVDAPNTNNINGENPVGSFSKTIK